MTGTDKKELPNPTEALEEKIMAVEILIRTARLAAHDEGTVRALLAVAEEQMIDTFEIYYRLCEHC